MSLGGSLTRQAEADHNVSDASPHIANIGRMVEVSSTFEVVVYNLCFILSRKWRIKFDQLSMKFTLAKLRISSMI